MAEQEEYFMVAYYHVHFYNADDNRVWVYLDLNRVSRIENRENRYRRQRVHVDFDPYSVNVVYVPVIFLNAQNDREGPMVNKPVIVAILDNKKDCEKFCNNIEKGDHRRWSSGKGVSYVSCTWYPVLVTNK